jgi:hypothetical protein
MNPQMNPQMNQQMTNQMATQTSIQTNHQAPAKRIPNLLYYTNKDIQCQILLTLLKNERLIDYFECICADDTPMQNENLPFMYIAKTKNKIQGNEIFQWIEKIREYRKNIWMQKITDIQEQKIKDVTSNVSMSELGNLLGFSKSEMDGVSDLFAYYDNQSDALPHNYVKYDDLKNDGNLQILTIAEDNPNCMRVNVNTQNRQLEALQKDRAKQDDNFKKQYNDIKTQLEDLRRVKRM